MGMLVHARKSKEVCLGRLVREKGSAIFIKNNNNKTLFSSVDKHSDALAHGS